MILLQVVAVAARQMDRAKIFADKHGIHTVYGDYMNLADDGDISEYADSNLSLISIQYNSSLEMDFYSLLSTHVSSLLT